MQRGLGQVSCRDMFQRQLTGFRTTVADNYLDGWIRDSISSIFIPDHKFIVCVTSFLDFTVFISQMRTKNFSEFVQIKNSSGCKSPLYISDLSSYYLTHTHAQLLIRDFVIFFPIFPF